MSGRAADPRGRRVHERLWPTVANLVLTVGALVFLITAATQTRQFGAAVGRAFGGDLLNVALLGLVVGLAAAAAAAAVVAPRSSRLRCLTGLVLSLSPVALLVYYLQTTAG